MEVGVRSTAADDTRSVLPSSTIRDLNIIYEIGGNVRRKGSIRSTESPGKGPISNRKSLLRTISGNSKKTECLLNVILPFVWPG